MIRQLHQFNKVKLEQITSFLLQCHRFYFGRNPPQNESFICVVWFVFIMSHYMFVAKHSHPLECPEVCSVAICRISDPG